MPDDFVPIDLPIVTTSRKCVALSLSPHVIEGRLPDRIELTWKADVLLEIRGNDGELLVEVLPDGTVNFGETYDPDEAARRFWFSLAGFPTIVPARGTATNLTVWSAAPDW